MPIEVTIERVGTLGVDYYYADSDAQTAGTKTWRSLELGEWLTAAKTGGSDVMDDTWSAAGLWHGYYTAADAKYHYKNSQLCPTDYFVTSTGVKANAAGASNTATPRDVAWAEYAVKVSAVATGTYTIDDVAELLEDTEVTVEVDTLNSSRAMFFDLKANTTTNKVCSLGAGNSNPSGLGDVVLNNIYSGGHAATIVIAHFGMYVDGDDSGTRDSSAVQGDFRVTVTGEA